MVRSADFDPTVPLPPGLTAAAIRKAIEYVEREASNMVELYFEQANVFSAFVGILGVRALDQHSVYEKSRNIDTAQQRFPDLKRRGSGVQPSPKESLEVKGSKRAWALQSHFDHPGWYIVFRYLVDETMSIESGKPVIVWRVDVAFLEKTDWKYEGSTAGDLGGGRTHTFGLRKPSSHLRGAAVYSRSDIILRAGKPISKNGED